MSEFGWDPESLAGLEAELMHTKMSTDASTFFPSHAYARGGIGVLVSTGSARGPLSRLPKATQACRSLTATGTLSPSRPSTCPAGSTRGSMRGWGAATALDVSGVASVAAASAIIGPAAGIPEVAKHEWERVVPHPANFVTTARQTRVFDVRPASKWATLSLYETDPHEVKRHLDIVDMVDQAHAEGKRADRDEENVRHFTWAVQQRETFRRQRQEAADRYLRSGLPVRKAYSARPANASMYASNRLAESLNGHSAAASLSGRASGPTVSLPKKTYVNVYQRMESEVHEARENSVQSARKRAEAAAKKKEAEELKSQMAEIDSFEYHVVGAIRQRGRQDGSDEDD